MNINLTFKLNLKIIFCYKIMNECKTMEELNDIVK